MATTQMEFKIGDLIWAKMKGFPPWPGKIMQPNPGVKKPTSDKKARQFVFFLGTQNYAWVTEGCIWHYLEHKETFTLTQRLPRGFQDAIDSMEELVKELPAGSTPARKSSVESGSSRSKESKHSKSKTPCDETKPGPSKSDQQETIRSDHAKKRSGSQLVSLQATKSRAVDREPPSPVELFPELKTKYDFDEVMSPKVTSRVPGRGGADDIKATSRVPVRDSSDEMKSPSGRPVKTDDDKMRMPRHEVPFMPDVLPSSVGDTGWTKSAAALKIGFLGLGLMGSSMVSCLLKSGHDVMVWNRTVAKCRELMKDGAEKGSSPCDVVQSCDITFSCVTDPMALKDLVFANCGVLQGITHGKSYVDMSTVDVETINDVHEAVAARGGRFLEAPVMGSKELALEGKLVILAAGNEDLYRDCFSCFQALGRHTFYLGEIGFATRMKLILNLLVGTTLAGLAESLSLASKVGLGAHELLQVLAHSTADSQLLRTKGAEIANSKFATPSCKLNVMQKDLRLAINMSDAVDQPLHVGSSVNELFKKAKARGYGDHDMSAVYRATDL